MAGYDFSNSPHVCASSKRATTSLNNAIYIASSPWFITLSSVAYFSIGIAAILTDWPIIIRLMLVCTLGLDYLRNLALHGLRNHACAISLIIPDCDKWQYQLLKGKGYKAKLIKQRSYCSSLILIFYLQHINGNYYLIIPRDALSKHNYRKLAFAFHNTI